MAAPDSIQHGFWEELSRLYYDKDKRAAEYLDGLDKDEAEQLGRQAARTIVAPFIWADKVGDRVDVRRASEFLNISRQALYKRVRTGTALGVPGRGTTFFPTWQFDFDKHLIRQVTGEIISVFREADEDVDPLVIAAWAMAENRLLDDDCPAVWIQKQWRRCSGSDGCPPGGGRSSGVSPDRLPPPPGRDRLAEFPTVPKEMLPEKLWRMHEVGNDPEYFAGDGFGRVGPTRRILGTLRHLLHLSRSAGSLRGDLR